MEIAVYAFFLALFLSIGLLPLLVRFAPKLGLLDYPNQRKLHHVPIPRIGGIAITIGIIVPVLLWVPMRPDIQAYLYAISLLVALMVFDDRGSLDFRLKFAGQILASAIVIIQGGVLISHFPFVPGGYLPDWLALPITLFVLVGVTNAINLCDGLDGLAGGTAILMASCLGLLAYEAGDRSAMMLALVVIGGTLGFLRYNTYPAWVYMGDTGSQCLGFSVGVLAIIVTQLSNPALSPVLPLLILGFPILDTVSVMARRKMAGQPLFSADQRHIHHRLLGIGLAFYEVVVVIYCAQIVLLILAYLLAYTGDGLLIGLYLMFCVIVLGGLSLAERLKNRTNFDMSSKWRLLAKWIDSIKRSGATTKVPHAILYYFLPALFIFVSLSVETATFDFGLIALILAIMLIVSVTMRQFGFFPIARFVIYFAAAIEVYLLSISKGIMQSCGDCMLVFYAVLAIVTAIWIRFSGNHFKFTSLDFLIIFVLVVTPNLPILQNSMVDLMAIEIMILFYASEVVISENVQKWTALHSGVFTSLVILSVRGLLM